MRASLFIAARHSQLLVVCDADAALIKTANMSRIRAEAVLIEWPYGMDSDSSRRKDGRSDRARDVSDA